MRNREEQINLEDCVKTMEDWAKELVDIEIRKRPEGKQLAGSREQAVLHSRQEDGSSVR